MNLVLSRPHQRGNLPMFKMLDWFRSHPVLIGPALLLTSIAAVLYLFIDPITVLFIAVISLTAGFAALVDPKTYSRKPPTKHTSVE